MAARKLIDCDVIAPTAAEARDWAKVVRTCAVDTAQEVKVRPRAGKAAVVTLHLPAALAAAQHPVWCLACRLACFLPHARVSVLVHGESAFRRTGRSAAAADESAA